MQNVEISLPAMWPLWITHLAMSWKMLGNSFRVKARKNILAGSWSFSRRQRGKIILGYNGSSELKIRFVLLLEYFLFTLYCVLWSPFFSNLFVWTFYLQNIFRCCKVRLLSMTQSAYSILLWRMIIY